MAEAIRTDHAARVQQAPLAHLHAGAQRDTCHKSRIGTDANALEHHRAGPDDGPRADCRAGRDEGQRTDVRTGVDHGSVLDDRGRMPPRRELRLRI